MDAAQQIRRRRPDAPLMLAVTEPALDPDAYRASQGLNMVLDMLGNQSWASEIGIEIADAATIGVGDGDRVRVTTPGGSAVAVAEVSDTMMQGHVALPNGLGLSYAPAGGDTEVTGVAPNELTTTDWCDPIVGTPWHKHVPARLEAVAR